MAKMSRMAKYKDLREGIKNEVGSSQQTGIDIDAYRRYMADDTDTTQLEDASREDTLTQSLTLDLVNEQLDEEVERALSKVREDAGQEQYNTRMDILNKIRKTPEKETAEEETAAEPEEKHSRASKHEEAAEEAAPEEKKHHFSLFKRNHQDEDEEEEEEDDEEEEEDEEGDSFFVKFLNIAIIVLGIVLVGLIAYIVVQLFL